MPVANMPQELVERLSRIDTSLMIKLPDGAAIPIGRSTPDCTITLKNNAAVQAVATGNEYAVCDAFLSGNIDFSGNMLAALPLRSALTDAGPPRSPWQFLTRYWRRSEEAHQRAIAAHYRNDPEFYLSFLDPTRPCYSFGMFDGDEDTFCNAIERKFRYCADACGLEPGDRVLEIGPGYGAFAAYAAEQGIEYVGLTDSAAAAEFLNARMAHYRTRPTFRHADPSTFKPDRPFNAVVMMSVVEHISDYAGLIRAVSDFLVDAGRVYIDGTAMTKKFRPSSVMVANLYAGNDYSLCDLPRFFKELHASNLSVLEFRNERQNWQRSYTAWARNLEANRDRIIERFGELEYRRYFLYLWGAVGDIQLGRVDGYRMILQADMK